MPGYGSGGRASLLRSCSAYMLELPEKAATQVGLVTMPAVCDLKAGTAELGLVGWRTVVDQQAIAALLERLELSRKQVVALLRAAAVAVPPVDDHAVDKLEEYLQRPEVRLMPVPL